MSHELRTPLNAIGGYAELLELGLRGPVSAEQREDLARIRRSQRHLLALVGDVLDLARLSAGQMAYELADVSVGDLVADLEALVTPQAAAKSLSYEAPTCAAEVVARADRARVLQILLNLVSSSVKFTPTGGRVALTCASDGATVRIGVTDSGIGIPADQLERVFSPFTQVHEGLTRTAEGTGLALAISRDLARGMGGDLTVESTPGVGSTFMLTLPSA